jgi:DNA processing protein
MIDGLIVVETGINGGAVITALLADDYHRDVMAFPGQVHHPYSAGCNKLIKSNKAAMVENAQDVLEMMGWHSVTSAAPHHQRSLFPELDPEEQLIFTLLAETNELYIDELQSRSNLTPGTLAGVLLSMEFKGLLLSLPGKRYKLDRVA